MLGHMTNDVSLNFPV